MTCATCDLGLHHCHGLVVQHDDGTATCLEGCGGPLAVHDGVAGCAELALGCCGDPVGEPRPRPADHEPARAAA